MAALTLIAIRIDNEAKFDERRERDRTRNKWAGGEQKDTFTEGVLTTTQYLLETQTRNFRCSFTGKAESK